MTDERPTASAPPTGLDPKSAPWIDMRGETWWIPSFSFDEIDRWLALGVAPPGETFEQLRIRMAAQIELAHAAIARNYPDLTLADLRRRVSFREYDTFINACMQANGLGRLDPELPAGTAASP